MADSQLGWSDAQWEKVNNAVTEAFAKASVASSVLPCYGPLTDSAEYVRNEQFASTGELVTVQDDTTLKLFNLTVDVDLSSEQAADESLATALLAFRRAANTLAQVEDDIVFNGFGDPRTEVRDFLEQSGFDFRVVDPFFPGVVRANPVSLEGLVHIVDTKTKARRTVGHGTADQVVDSALRLAIASLATTAGDHLVTDIASAIVTLESASHPGPFACILGANAFVEAYRPAAGSLVLPADRITPMLNGPLLRSGRLASDLGVVVSLAANAIDIVVATPPTAQFLQIDQNARRRFRVYEKFMLRIKDRTAVQGVSI